MKYQIWLLFIIPTLLQGELDWKTEKGPIQIELSLSSEKVPLNSSFILSATFRYPVYYQLDVDSSIKQLIETPNPLYPYFSLNQQKLMIEKEGNDQIQRLTLLLEPLMIGPLELSFFNLFFNPLQADRDTIEIFTPVFIIQAQAPVPVEPQFFPHGPLLPLAPQFPLNLTEANRQVLYRDPQALSLEAQHNEQLFIQRRFPWMTVSFFFLLLLARPSFQIFRHFYKRKQSSLPAVSPQLRALEAIQGLDFEENSSKTLYTKLTESVVAFFEEDLQISLRPYTTDELRSVLPRFLSSQAIERLMEIFIRADQAKFANKQVLASQWQKDKQTIQALLQSYFSKPKKPSTD